MKLQAQIEALESLAALDEIQSRLEAELSTQGDELAQKKSEIQQLEERFETTKSSVGDMDKMRGELLQDARHMSLQMDRSREKLARSRTEREVNAAQREIEELRKLYRDRELEIEKINGLAEQARIDMDSVSKKRAQLLEDLGDNERTLSNHMGNLEGELAESRKRREELVAAVPRALYRRYEMVRKRRGSAVAWTTTGTCSECHISISPMMFQQLRRGEEFDQCPSCQRILYFRETPPETAEDDATSAETSGTSDDAEGAVEQETT